jgi:hypothetical protein
MRIRKGIVIVGGAAVVIIGGAGTAYAEMSSSGPAYRLATVTSANVTATLNEVGTLMPAQQADVAFGVGGTVATVAVSAGQQVTAGQTLGTLGTSALKATLTAAQSTLASAQLTVAGDITSEDAAVASPAGSTSSGPPSANRSPGRRRPGAGQDCSGPGQPGLREIIPVAEPVTEPVAIAQPHRVGPGHLRQRHPAGADRRDRGAA